MATSGVACLWVPAGRTHVRREMASMTELCTRCTCASDEPAVKLPISSRVCPRRLDRDLYKWAYKLSPAIPSDLTADCFDLAREVRELDMRAAPYDLRPLGYEPVMIETPEGKAAYVDAQRDFGVRAQVLRLKLIDGCDSLLRPGLTAEPPSALDG